MDSSRVVIIGVILCVLACGLGIVIGYFAIKRPTEQHDDTVVIPDYQKSCDAKCTDEAKIVKSCSPPLPRHYVAHHLNGKTITVDGRLDDDAWKDVPWTENFMDIRGPQFPAPPVETKAKIRWDDQALYVGAYMQEPNVWATMAEKDTRIYKENAFEVFLDVDNSMTMYKEIEINAINTTWDLMLERAYMDGGDWTDWEGIREKGVYTDGVVNNATVPATFWSMEMSFPFVNLNENTNRTHLTPLDGEWWFMILARPRYDLEALPDGTYQKKPGTDATWISWNPIGAVNLHLPSKWGLLFFEKDAPTSTPPTVKAKRWLTYQALFDVFNALKAFQVQRGTYVDVLSELDLPPYITTGSCLKSVNITLSSGGFRVSIESKSEPGFKGHITQNRHVTFTTSDETDQFECKYQKAYEGCSAKTALETGPHGTGSQCHLCATSVVSQCCDAKCTDEAEIVSSCSPRLPRHYVAHHLNGKTITVDGRLHDDAWKDVPWTENFMDIRGPQFPAPPVETKAKIRWDDQAVYVGAYMQEPNVWATMAEKDTRIYKENAFEVFLDVDNSMTMYKEIEINAINTTWDLMLERAYMDGGDWTDWEGIREKGVYTDGVVNNATVPATFWSMEMSFPFVNLNENTTRTHRTPLDGEWWFMNLARPRYDLEALPDGTYQKKPGTDATWISWNPTGAVNLHLPSKWGLLFFEKDAPTSTPPTVKAKRWLTYQALFDVFNALKAFQAQRGTYVDVLSELDLPPYITTGSCLKSVNITLSSGSFMVSIESKSEPEFKGHITQNRHVTFTTSE